MQVPANSLSPMLAVDRHGHRNTGAVGVFNFITNQNERHKMKPELSFIIILALCFFFAFGVAWIISIYTFKREGLFLKIVKIRKLAESMINCSHSLCSTQEALAEEKIGKEILEILNGRQN